MLESTIVRAQQQTAGALKSGSLKAKVLALSRSGFPTKIHLRSNGLALPIAVTLTGGQTVEVKVYAGVMDNPSPEPRALLADKGYDADFIPGDPEARVIDAVTAAPL